MAGFSFLTYFVCNSVLKRYFCVFFAGVATFIVVITTHPLLGVGRLRAAEARWRLASKVGGGGGGERRAAAAAAGGSDEVAHQWCM